MLKLVLGVVVLMVSACQSDEIGSRYKVATADMDAEQDTQPEGTNTEETEKTEEQTAGGRMFSRQAKPFYHMGLP